MDTKTLYAKLATVPPQIKSWLSSEGIVDYVNNIDNQFILPRESSSIIKKISQRLLVKDLAPEYFAGELAMELKLDKDKAAHISSEIKKNIFFPQKAVLSNYGIDIDLLDKFQMPIIKPSVNNSPKILEDIELMPVVPSTPKPTTLSDIGWSKQPVAASNIGVSATIPTPASVPTPTPISPRPPVVPVPKSAAAAVAEPAPMMLHEDTTFKPAEKNAGFMLSKSGGTAEMSMNRGVPQAPARAAVLEFGGGARTPIPKPPMPTSSSARPMTISTGARNVSQIMPTMPAPVLKPPAPPMPPRPSQAPPKPPTPPSASIAQPNKPIVKDFL
jgi:hypothetical protein